MKTRYAYLACSLVFASACATGQAEDSPSEPALGVHSAALAADPLPGDAKGFFHSFAQSKFHAGGSPGELSDHGLRKVIGDEGAFAVDPRNGSVRALLDADAPAQVNFRPLTTDNDTHNKHVLEYFQSAGLPADQIADVQAFPSLSGGRDVSGASSKDALVDIASVVHRKVRGISVPDSFAWAIFDAQGETVQESVHWPSIKASVIAQAVALQQKLATPANAAAFKKLLPTDVAALPGDVVIRHASTADADAAPFAAYDVVVGQGRRQQSLHFDANGQRLTHPSARNDGAGEKKPAQ